MYLDIEVLKPRCILIFVNFIFVRHMIVILNGAKCLFCGLTVPSRIFCVTLTYLIKILLNPCINNTNMIIVYLCLLYSMVAKNKKI